MNLVETATLTADEIHEAANGRVGIADMTECASVAKYQQRVDFWAVVDWLEGLGARARLPEQRDAMVSVADLLQNDLEAAGLQRPERG